MLNRISVRKINNTANLLAGNYTSLLLLGILFLLAFPLVLGLSVSAQIILPPFAPTGVTATAHSSSSITIKWTASTGATAYQIFNSTSPSGPFTKFGGTAATQYTSSGLPPSTTYYYEVRAGNTGGWSALSSPPVSATTHS